MRNPVVAAIARACVARGSLALPFNFRGVGTSAGERTEPTDLADAVAHARSLAPSVPLGVRG